MKYAKFRIENFKGIKDLSIELGSGSRIYTLVGLNESGKTTILEALSVLYDQRAETEPVGTEPLLHTIKIEDIHSLIPKALQANFNDSVRLSADVILEPADHEGIQDMIAQAGYELVDPPAQANVAILSYFKNSSFYSTERKCDVALHVRSKGKGKKKVRPLAEADAQLYDEVGLALLRLIPPIIYYPNFLFAFPDKIYVESGASQGAEQPFYRTFLQDVLHTIDSELYLTTHVVTRAKSSEAGDRDAMEQVINKMQSSISGLVFNPEISVFKLDITSDRRVVISRPEADSKGLYVTIRYQDGDVVYGIKDRSLGFQWFFTFLLLTRFRAQRSGPDSSDTPLFLFDEPASNLHQRAQQRLLTALEQLSASGPGISIMYTTHSHHLIDPRRLEATFIVRNLGLTNPGVDTSYSANETAITMTKYRTFVGKYPDQRDYFQPILDVLEYRPSNLEDVPHVVMLEGKTDYYTFEYLQLLMSIPVPDRISILPGGGAGSLDCPIGLYIGWARPFVVLLDADTEGKKQQSRYVESFGYIARARVLTLASIDPSWDSKRLEDLLEASDRLAIIRTIFPEMMKYSKKRFHHAVQELLMKGQAIMLSETTMSRFKSLFETLRLKLDALTHFD